MNKENIEYAIKVMKGAENLHMCSFQGGPAGEEVDTVKQLHACGNTACFAGYLCLTPKWKGFFKNKYGKNTRFRYDGDVFFDGGGYLEVEESISEFLGVSRYISSGLVYNTTYVDEEPVRGFYDVDFFLTK